MFFYLYIWSCNLCDRMTSFCLWRISRKLCRFLLFLTGFTSLSVLLHFPLSRSSSLCTVFDGISYNMDEVLLINPSTNVFVFGEFSIHHRDWLTFSGGTGKPGELWYYFFISNDLAQMVNFPIRNSDCDSHSQY